MTTVYKKDKKGNIQQWSIEVDGNKFRTHEGLVNGKITTSEWTVCKGKSIGKKNETTPEQQALLESESKLKSKLENGYYHNIKDAGKGTDWIEPMLAEKFADYGDKILSTLSTLSPVYSQPKLDGIRCIATRSGLFSRKGKPIVAVPHIEKVMMYLLITHPNVIAFDGELYNHDLKEDFNKITSVVRKTKLTKEDLEQSEKLIQYHIYDCITANQSSFEERLGIILEQDEAYIRIVPTHKIVSEQALDRWYTQYQIDGYEGQMIRDPKSLYEHKRTKSLIKRKEFMDEEFTILDIEEGIGNRSGMMGRLKFKTKEGKAFDSNARGGNDFYKELLQNKTKYIGKLATVRFQNYTPDGIPRFPVMISLRDYE